MRGWGVLVIGLASTGCLEHQRGFFSIEEKEALNIPAPLTDRCTKYKRGSSEATGCSQLRQTAVEWTRHLNVGDEICMDNTFAEPAGPNCKARGVLTDAGGDGFIIEIRDARTDSTWYTYNERKIWYATGAMVDTYLKERGYE